MIAVLLFPPQTAVAPFKLSAETKMIDFSAFQAHESLISGHFPASEETLQHLAALRLQYLHGDGAGRAGWSLGSVYPIGRLRNRILQSTKPGAGTAPGAGSRGSGGIGDVVGSIGGQSGVGAGSEKRKTPTFRDTSLKRSKTGSLKKQKVSGGEGRKSIYMFLILTVKGAIYD